MFNQAVSEISGVSVRTLHHYDRNWIAPPDRYYSDEASQLPNDSHYKYLGFSLKKKSILLKEARMIVATLKVKLMQKKKADISNGNRHI